MGQSLIAFDTDHIKRYVFATNRLKEIRGASSLLDLLNREVMTRVAREKYGAQCIYANGGSGLFCVEADKAREFGEYIQRTYRDCTAGGASITYACEPLPEGFAGDMDEDAGDALKLLQWRLQEKKLQPPPFIALPSNPFMRPCDACGVAYASPEEGREPGEDIRNADEEESRMPPREVGEEDELYCASCQEKRRRDFKVKNFISSLPGKRAHIIEPLWSRILEGLQKFDYDLPPEVDRPRDFNVFTVFKGMKDYLALIYADGNNIGDALDKCKTLRQRREFAERIDGAIYDAVCAAIAEYLPIKDHATPQALAAAGFDHPLLPFDILMLGGDDVMMVVPASVAFDIALRIAGEFRRRASEGEEQHTLSVGVVLAPVKYPFGLTRTMAETTLKFAKKASAEARTQARGRGQQIDDTRINFLVVTGGSSSNFKAVYESVYHKKFEEMPLEFFATLRPYAPDDLSRLLEAIRGGHALNLGRTKLHQLREVVLQMNVTTAVSESMALLNNWHNEQRQYIASQVYEFGSKYQLLRSDPHNPAAGFPRVIFPWFDDSPDKRSSVYRTLLLDFVELYDFVFRGGENERDEN